MSDFQALIEHHGRMFMDSTGKHTNYPKFKVINLMLPVASVDTNNSIKHSACEWLGSLHAARNALPFEDA